MDEKRSELRRDTLLYLRITSPETGEEIGRLADISTTGALVITGQPLPASAELTGCIHLPPRLSADQEEICGTLSPRWSRPDRNPKLILNGCLFATTEEDQKVLKYLIDEYGFNNGTIDFRKRFERSKQSPDEES